MPRGAARSPAKAAPVPSAPTAVATPATPSVASPPEFYTVILRGHSFTLSASQIAFDSPNFFTTAFNTGGFVEASTRTVNSDRRPDLFAIILEYLSGYDALPFEIPGESEMQSMKRLRIEADYWELKGLVTLADQWLDAGRPDYPAYPHGCNHEAYTFRKRIIPFRTHPDLQPMEGCSPSSLVRANINKELVERGPFESQLFSFQDLQIQLDPAFENNSSFPRSESNLKFSVTFLNQYEWESRKDWTADIVDQRAISTPLKVFKSNTEKGEWSEQAARMATIQIEGNQTLYSISNFNDWRNDSPRSHNYPELTKMFAGHVDKLKSLVLNVPSAIGFFSSGANLHLVHVVVSPTQRTWTAQFDSEDEDDRSDHELAHKEPYKSGPTSDPAHLKVKLPPTASRS